MVRATLGHCEAPGCSAPRYLKHRYCSTHWMRLYRYGDFESRRPVAAIRVSGGYLSYRGQRIHRLVLMDVIGPGEHPCHWCGRPVSWDRSYPKDIDGLVVDHLDGNKMNNDPANLVPACNPCNTRRRNRVA